MDIASKSSYNKQAQGPYNPTNNSNQATETKKERDIWVNGIKSLFKFGQIIKTYVIYNGIQYYKISMQNDELFTFTFIILIFEFCFILWGARIAWSLRAVNPQFNESKHIAVILYHTFLIVLLIGIFFILLNINPHILRILWMGVWLLMIAFAVSVLMIPKFRFVICILFLFVYMNLNVIYKHSEPYTMVLNTLIKA